MASYSLAPEQGRMPRGARSTPLFDHYWIVIIIGALPTPNPAPIMCAPHQIRLNPLSTKASVWSPDLNVLFEKQREFIDYKTSMITNEDPLRGLSFYQDLA